MQVRTKSMTFVCIGATTLFALVLLVGGERSSVGRRATAQELVPPAAPSPSSSANYSGTTKCAACHYSQFKDWKASAHGKAYEILPRKYRQDKSCLECHLVGHDPDELAVSGPNMTAGVSCEACHGPGDEHVRYGLTFIGQGRELNEESMATLRSKIERTSMDRCVKCHSAIAHKPHPEYDREGEPGQTKVDSNRSKSFFQVHR